MSGFDPQRLFAALTLLVIAAFVSSGYAPAARWRRPLRAAAIVGFALALAAAVVEVALWWAAAGR